MRPAFLLQLATGAGVVLAIGCATGVPRGPAAVPPTGFPATATSGRPAESPPTPTQMTTAPTAPEASPTTAARQPSPRPPNAARVDAGMPAVAFGPPGCAVTPSFLRDPAAPPPDDFPAPSWYHNAEGTLWAGLAPPYLGKWYAGMEQKVRWWARGNLSVTGHRLDGSAPPLEAWGEGQSLDRPAATLAPPSSPPPTGSGRASSIKIPVAGCWEVTARTPWDELRFVVYAYPTAYTPSLRSASTLPELVKNADAVVLGRVETTAVDSGAFLRQTLRVSRAWKGLGAGGDHLIILQDQNPPTGGEPTLQVGGDYILFLERRPEGLWRIIAPFYTTAEVVDGQVRPIHAPGAAGLWKAQPIAQVEVQLSQSAQ